MQSSAGRRGRLTTVNFGNNFLVQPNPKVSFRKFFSAANEGEIMENLINISKINNHFLCHPADPLVVVDDEIHFDLVKSLHVVEGKNHFNTDYAPENLNNTCYLKPLNISINRIQHNNQKNFITQSDEGNLLKNIDSHTPSNMGNHGVHDNRKKASELETYYPRLNTVNNQGVINHHLKKSDNASIADKNCTQANVALKSQNVNNFKANTVNVPGGNNYSHPEATYNCTRDFYPNSIGASEITDKIQRNSLVVVNKALNNSFETAIKVSQQANHNFQRNKPVNHTVEGRIYNQQTQSNNHLLKRLHKGNKSTSQFAEILDSTNVRHQSTRAIANVVGTDHKKSQPKTDFREIGKVIDAFAQVDWGLVLKSQEETRAQLSSFENGICSFYPGYESVIGPDHGQHQSFNEYFDEIFGTDQ